MVTMFERFTARARRVLVLAQEEARLLNHDFIGTEHLLLGLIHEGEGLAAKALEGFGITLDAARAKVEETKGVSGPSTGSPPFTSRSKKVLELALRESMRLGHDYIDTEPILLGLVREGEGVGTQVLASLGADLARVRQQVIRLLPAGSAPLASPTGWIEEVGMVTVGKGHADSPRCPRCNAALEGDLAYRVVTAEAVGSHDPTDGSLQVIVVYCSCCGSSLGIVPPPAGAPWPPAGGVAE